MFFCVWLVFAPTARAATAFGGPDGMPSTMVQSIAIDGRGFVWIATQDGLSSFDGHRFESVPLTPPGLVPDEHARRLLVAEPFLFVATSTRLMRVDLRTRAVKQILDAGAALPDIQALRRDTNGEVLFGSAKGKLWRLSTPESEPRIVVFHQNADLAGITAIAGNAERLWLSTANGLYEVPRDTLVPRRFSPVHPEFLQTDPWVASIHQDRRGRLWIGYWNDGLLRFDPESNETRWFHPARVGADFLASSSVLGFLETEGRVYVASNRGITWLDESCDCLKPLSHPEWDKVDGNGVIITELAADEGGVWAGVWGRGLVRFTDADRFFERQVPVDDRPGSLSHPMVYSLLVDRHHRLWIGSYGGFVQSATPAQREATQFWSTDTLPRNGLRNEARFVWSMMDAGDRVLIGTGYGLFSATPDSVDSIDPSLQSIRSFITEPDGSVLIGQVRGLTRLKGGRLERQSLPEGLPSSLIWSMVYRDRELWLGTNRGLARVDAAFHLVKLHETGMGDADLPGPVVWTQKIGPDGRHWLGTSGGLVDVVEGADGPVFRRHPRIALRGGPRSIGSIEFAGPDELWLGTPRGLVRYRPSSEHVRRFDSRDGLISDQLHNNASASDGRRFYFGGSGGVVAFDPADAPKHRVNLRPDVVRIKVGSGNWVSATEILDLPPDPPSVQLELSAFHFDRPERVRFSYRWLPFQDEFAELGDAHQAVFTDLPAGERVLELCAELDGQAVERKVLVVRVAQAWHETWIGRTILAAGVLLIGLGLFGWRIRAIRANADELRRQVALRTSDLRAATEELAAANTRLRERVATDSLTGLASRHAALEKIREWHQAHRPLGVLLIDLDHFKRINDEHGHLVGDAVLVQFAKAMREALPEFVSARYGGEEFFAFRDTADLQLLMERAHQLRESVHRQEVRNDQGHPVRYTVSIGAAVMVPGETVNALIRRADAAMYRAKAAGRDQILSG